jgi:hypothetical protein
MAAGATAEAISGKKEGWAEGMIKTYQKKKVSLTIRFLMGILSLNTKDC